MQDPTKRPWREVTKVAHYYLNVDTLKGRRNCANNVCRIFAGQHRTRAFLFHRVDLLFFHRRLRCLVIIDLKIGRFTHADAGQMHLYLDNQQVGTAKAPPAREQAKRP